MAYSEAVLDAAERLPGLFSKDLDLNEAKKLGQQFLFLNCDEAVFRRYLEAAARLPNRSQKTQGYHAELREVWTQTWRPNLSGREKAAAWLWGVGLAQGRRRLGLTEATAPPLGGKPGASPGPIAPGTKILPQTTVGEVIGGHQPKAAGAAPALRQGDVVEATVVRVEPNRVTFRLAGEARQEVVWQQYQGHRNRQVGQKVRLRVRGVHDGKVTGVLPVD